MIDDPDGAAGPTFDRRTLMSVFGMLVASAALESCSSTEHAASPSVGSTGSSGPSATSPSTGVSSGSVTASSNASTSTAAGGDLTTTAPAAGSTTSSTGAATSTTAALRTVAFDYPVPVDEARLQELADRYNGEWTGNWAEETGGTGSVAATVAIDPATRSVSVRFSYTGPLLQGGAGTPELIDLTIPDGTTPEDLDVSFGATGDAVYTYEGGTTASFSAPALPGNDAALSADLSLLGDEARASYSVTAPGGVAVLGAGVVARNRTPAAIDISGIREQQLFSDLATGRYAANLLDIDAASLAVGATLASLDDNGGNLVYRPGVVTSNVRAMSADGVLVVQITVYRCVDVATALDFWNTFLTANYPNDHIAGYGDDAIQYPGLEFTFLSGRCAAAIGIIGLTDVPLPVDAVTAEHNLATLMVPAMAVAP